MKKSLPTIMALHRPTDTVRWALWSDDGVTARVDPKAGEELADFSIYKIRFLDEKRVELVGRALRCPVTYS